MAELLSKYFNLDSAILAGPLCICAFSNYLEMVQNGVPVEQARAVLPECTLTNLYMHVNLRSLIEMARLRLCTKSENEIRRFCNLSGMDTKSAARNAEESIRRSKHINTVIISKMTK